MGSDITENIQRTFARIEDAAQRVGRDPSEVRLIAVSKSQDAAKIREAHALGLRDFGENRVHEALPKQEMLSALEGIRWHMVGHIQSRKARDVVPNFFMVHSVDRMKIAQRLNDLVSQREVHLPVLIECNVSGEGTKGGWLMTDRAAWEENLPVLTQITELGNIRVCGLMTMAPWTEEEKILRNVFGKLRALQGFLNERIPGYWQELSMGMTDDFELAIEEGSTMVRIGRAIFGPRREE